MPPVPTTTSAQGPDGGDAPVAGVGAVWVERPSFQDLYAQQFDFVWRCVAHRGIPNAALDDVVQEVFIVVHRKLPEFEGRSSVRTWLGGITRRVVADYIKKRGNRPAADEPLTIEPPAAVAADPGATRDALRLFDELLAGMNEVQREVFVLSEVEHLSGAEIAEITGTNENTVWTRLRAARRLFQAGVDRAKARERGGL